MISWNFDYVDEAMKLRLRAICGNARDTETVTVRVGDVLALLRVSDDHGHCEDDQEGAVKDAKEEAFDEGAASRSDEIENLQSRLETAEARLAEMMLADA